MKLREGQKFLALDDQPQAVEVAHGTGDPYALAAQWQRRRNGGKELGQVATPKPIAAIMAEWVASRQPRTVLDPAVGLGNLLHECRQRLPEAELTGIDRDATSLRHAVESAPRGTKLVCADYLKTDVGLMDGIIANPPYVKAHHLDYGEAEWRGFEERLGTPLDRLTNIYALFLLKIWEDLAAGGRAAVLIPAEFLNANFGVEIKERFVRSIRPRGIAIFRPETNLFDSALTTSCILFLERGRPTDAPVDAARVGSIEEARNFLKYLLAEPRHLRKTSYTDLSRRAPNEKWLNRLLAPESASFAQLPCCVGDYFDCRRGIATGANDFFCLRKSELAAHGLNLFHVERCVTKAMDADGLVFSAERFETLLAADKRCFLLNPRRDGPEVAAYLQIGRGRHIPQRHLPSHRPVWYLPENRQPADIWVAVFSRESVKYILNTSGAKNLTCFHGLYAKNNAKGLAPAMTLFLNSSWGREAFMQVNRFYGDGLNKLEPKDVEDMPCPEFPPFPRTEALSLTGHLSELECLPPQRRQTAVDKLAVSLLALPRR